MPVPIHSFIPQLFQRYGDFCTRCWVIFRRLQVWSGMCKLHQKCHMLGRSVFKKCSLVNIYWWVSQKWVLAWVAQKSLNDPLNSNKLFIHYSVTLESIIISDVSFICYILYYRCWQTYSTSSSSQDTHCRSNKLNQVFFWPQGYSSQGILQIISSHSVCWWWSRSETRQTFTRCIPCMCQQIWWRETNPK